MTGLTAYSPTPEASADEDRMKPASGTCAGGTPPAPFHSHALHPHRGSAADDRGRAGGPTATTHGRRDPAFFLWPSFGAFLGDLIGCAALFFLLFAGLWAGSVML